MLKLTLETQYLASAILCASSEKTRYYLCGACITWRPQERAVHYDATNGHIAFMARRSVVEDTEAQGAMTQIIIPTDAIKAALKIAGRRQQTIELEKTESGWTLGAVRFARIDWTFPDIASVMPEDDAEEAPAQFNGDYVAIMQKALCPARNKQVGHYVHIRHLGDNPAPAFGTLDDAFGMIMSVRPSYDYAQKAIPAWARHSRTDEGAFGGPTK